LICTNKHVTEKGQLPSGREKDGCGAVIVMDRKRCTRRGGCSQTQRRLRWYRVMKDEVLSSNDPMDWRGREPCGGTVSGGTRLNLLVQWSSPIQGRVCFELSLLFKIFKLSLLQLCHSALSHSRSYPPLAPPFTITTRTTNLKRNRRQPRRRSRALRSS
jgi:hypothetical protein